METDIESRAEKLINPFLNALESATDLNSKVCRANSEDHLSLPSVAISVSGGEERLDHGGDSWDYQVTITASRGPTEYHLLDNDAAVIERITSNAMSADPNISYMILQEGSEMSWPINDKVRQFEIQLPIFVVFS